MALNSKYHSKAERFRLLFVIQMKTYLHKSNGEWQQLQRTHFSSHCVHKQRPSQVRHNGGCLWVWVYVSVSLCLLEADKRKSIGKQISQKATYLLIIQKGNTLNCVDLEVNTHLLHIQYCLMIDYIHTDTHISMSYTYICMFTYTYMHK